MAFCAAPAGFSQDESVRQLDLGRLRNFVSFRLRRFQSKLAKEFELYAPDADLKPGLLSTLALMESNPGITQSRLSRELGQLQNVTVQIVDHLENEGLAKRLKSRTDRRCHELYVTPEGRDKLEEYFEAAKSAERTALMHMTNADRRELDELMMLFSGADEFK